MDCAYEGCVPLWDMNEIACERCGKTYCKEHHATTASKICKACQGDFGCEIRWTKLRKTKTKTTGLCANVGICSRCGYLACKEHTKLTRDERGKFVCGICDALRARPNDQ